jgi:hypothetical protein
VLETQDSYSLSDDRLLTLHQGGVTTLSVEQSMEVLNIIQHKTNTFDEGRMNGNENGLHDRSSNVGKKGMMRERVMDGLAGTNKSLQYRSFPPFRAAILVHNR